MRKCSVAGCSDPLLARGWCRKHYLRNYRYGDVTKVHRPSEYIPNGKAAAQYKHGHWQHPLYKTWRNMISRCENPADHAYANYGARGIAVCERWHDIAAFVADMGDRPPGTTLEREDNERGYSPDNCAWATMTAQSRNRRFTKLTPATAKQIRSEPRRGANGRGVGLSKAEIAAKYGVSVATIKKVLSGAYWRSVEKIVPSIAGAMKR